jgi:hypothetical protein
MEGAHASLFKKKEKKEKEKEKKEYHSSRFITTTANPYTHMVCYINKFY